MDSGKAGRKHAAGFHADEGQPWKDGRSVCRLSQWCTDHIELRRYSGLGIQDDRVGSEKPYIVRDSINKSCSAIHFFARIEEHYSCAAFYDHEVRALTTASSLVSIFGLSIEKSG